MPEPISRDPIQARLEKALHASRFRRVKRDVQRQASVEGTLFFSLAEGVGAAVAGIRLLAPVVSGYLRLREEVGLANAGHDGGFSKIAASCARKITGFSGQWRWTPYEVGEMSPDFGLGSRGRRSQPSPRRRLAGQWQKTV